MDTKRVEILSPAGSMESFRAAINAGADAIYLGGNMFGARAFANNFDQNQMIEALDLAHIHNVKVYLTVNTLLKNAEIEHSLFEFLKPAYEHGLDAVLVQDLGVFEFIKRHFPKLDIHASTQMTTNSEYSAKLLEQMGVTRVVTSRELSLEEIRNIRKNTSIEIESFVHGALCYCYSGQCLMSSMIGGRSGNRGRCAQPCRLQYDVLDANGAVIRTQGRHVISPKDMCALELLPDIIEAGVYSLKIEGRMKSPEYTAGVVSIYRKYVDMYLKYGRKKYHVDEQDVQKLMDLFNRGNFSNGYYNTHNGIDMMSMMRPNHQGTAAIEIVEVSKGRMKVKALEELYPQDIVDVTPEFTWTNGQGRKSGEVFTINIPQNLKVRPKNVYYRVRNNKLLSEIDEQYINQNRRESIQVEASVCVGEPIRIKATCRGIEACVTGSVVQQAQSRPMDEAQISKQLSKLGNTEFVAKDILVEIIGMAFVPVQELNELRRELIDKLQNQLILTREVVDIQQAIANKELSELVKTPDTYVMVSNTEQLDVVVGMNSITRIYYDMAIGGLVPWKSIVDRSHQHGKEIYLAMPHVFRGHTIKRFNSCFEEIMQAGFDGFLVRNLDEYSFLLDNQVKWPIVLDYSVYHFNDWMEHNAIVDGASGFTAPLELSGSELMHMDNSNTELIVYGYIPYMISAQCVMKNSKKCQQGSNLANSKIYLKDRMGKQMAVVNYCHWCYNVIYGSDCLNLLGQMEKIMHIAPRAVRIDVSMLEVGQIKELLNKAIETIYNGKEYEWSDNYTKGHFLRGIE